MSRRAGVARGRPLAARAWLAGCGLGLCALVAWAQERQGETVAPAPAAARPEVTHEELRRSLGQLAGQVAQLRQATVQSGRAQLGQGDAIRQQVAGVERSQARLGERLQALHDSSLRQVEGLHAVNRALWLGLWALGAVALALLVLAWRWRPAARVQVAPPQPGPLEPSLATGPTGHPVPAAVPAAGSPPATATLVAPGVGQAAGAGDRSPPVLASPVAPATPADAAVPARPDAPSVPAVPVSPEPAPAAAAPWAALVAADLRSTEQAFAQAREGFMQPAPIDS